MPPQPPQSLNPSSSSYPTTTSSLPSSTQPPALPPSSSSSSAARTRQYTHLHAQLARLNAHLADTENLLRMTGVQAEYVRGLGAWWGGAFMAASKVLGEEGGEQREREKEKEKEKEKRMRGEEF